MKKLLIAMTVVVAAAGAAKAGRYARSGGMSASETQSAGGAATFTVGTATAARGQLARGAIKVPAGVDAGYDIPVAVIHGARPGPVLAVVSGSHGTEYASIVAVEQLIDAIKPVDVSGTVILVPLVNIASFEQIVPHVNPVDAKSMNRFFPGNPNGTQTDRASYARGSAMPASAGSAETLAISSSPITTGAPPPPFSATHAL
jgi:hypothetical protein